MSLAFRDILVDGSSLLRELPRRRDDVEEARARFEHFRASHPDLEADLLVDHPPGAPMVEYDLLIGHPDGGTVALSWRADHGSPWCVEHTEHWAANFVLSVNDVHVTVQHAILSLKLAAQRSPDVFTRLVDEQLIGQEIEKDPPPVSDEELQAEADVVRAANNLHRADATLRWLEEMSITTARFEDLLRFGVQVRTLKERVTRDGVAAYFDSHRPAFDVIQVFRLDSANDESVLRLADTARAVGLWPAVQSWSTEAQGVGIRGSLASQYAFEAPTELAAAEAGAIVGPVADGGRYWMAVVLSRQAGKLDEPTREAIRDLLFEEWLAERRARADIRWHWM